MIYNLEEKRPKTNADCLGCPHKSGGICIGIGKKCVEAEENIMTGEIEIINNDEIIDRGE